jgi:hypothetical protein
MSAFYEYIHPEVFDRLVDVRKYQMDNTAVEIETEKNFFITVKNPGVNQYVSTDIVPMREVVKKHKNKKVKPDKPETDKKK